MYGGAGGVCVCVRCVGVCTLCVRPLPGFYLHSLFFGQPVHFTIPALAQAIWAQHAVDNLRPFVIIAPTRNCGSKNWLVHGWP